MSDTVKEILKRTSIAIIILGAILLIIGASGNVNFGNFSLTLSDLIARFVVGIFGSILLMFGGYIAWRETSSTTASESGKFTLIASGDSTKQSFRLEKYLNGAKTIDLLGYSLKGMLQDLRDPLAQAIIQGAIVRIVVVDITSPSANLLREHSRRPQLLLSEWITGLQHISDIQKILSNAPKVSGRLEVKVTSWIPSSNLILINANDENGILKAGIHSVTFRQPLSDRLSLTIKRKDYPHAFNFFVKGFDILWNEDSVVWDGRIPEIQ
jgi:hypothetical protein